MSTISKLSIRGIRSFGIDKEDEQKITFSSPLTLIVGQNGCGKTTVIECLKYALTGDVPPGTNRGQGFVHDPSIFNSTESLGQVKLQIKDIKGNTITCSRSMKTTIKKKKLYFESLDATVHAVGDNGKPIDISKRCLDATTEMCYAMGVSKPILNNVIFCHQEDSNWPLDEGKKVKEKFDAIFETTQYNKAIDKIIKHRKNYQGLLKDRTNDLKVLEIKKKECENKQLEMKFNSDKLEKFNKEMDNCEAALKPLDEKMTKIQETEVHLGKIAGQKTQLTMEIKSCKEKQEKLKENIRNPLDLDITALKRELGAYASTRRSNEMELQSINKEVSDLRVNEKNSQRKINELEQMIKLFILQIQKEQNLDEERKQEMEKICEKLNIPINDDLENSQYFSEVSGNVKSKIKNEEKKLQNFTAEQEKSDHEYQVKIDKLREEKTANSTSIGSKKTQLSNLEKEDVNAKREIESIKNVSRNLENLLESIEKAEKDQEAYEKTANIEQKKTDLVAKKAERQNLKDRLAIVDEEFNILHSFSAKTNEIELKTEDKAKKRAELQRIKNKHVENLKTLFPDRSVDADFKATVLSCYKKIDGEFGVANRSLNDSRMKASELNSQRISLKKQLKTDEDDLTKIEETIYEACQGMDYQSAVARLKEKIEELQMDFGYKKSSETFYTRFIANISSNACCPLCHKGLAGREGADLEDEIREKIQSLPGEIETAERILNAEKLKYDKLVAIRSRYESIETLKKKIAKAKEELRKCEVGITETQDKIGKLETETSKLKTRMNLANSMLGDMSLLDESNKDIMNKETEIELLRVQLPDDIPSRSMNEVKEDKKNLTLKINELEKAIQRAEDALQKSQDKLHESRANLDHLKNTKMKTQERVMNLERLKQRTVEIEGLKKELNKEIQDLQEKLSPIQAELEKLVRDKETAKKDAKNEISKKQAFLGQISGLLSEIERLSREIEKLKNEKNPDKMTVKEKDLENEKTRQKNLQKSLNEKQKKIEDLNSAIVNHDLNERNLKDNLELKQLEQSQVELEQKLEDLLKSTAGIDIPKLVAEKKNLMRQLENNQENRSRIRGQMSEVQYQIDSLKKQLEKGELKNAHSDYMKVYREATVIEALMRDLNKYKNALEWALMKYHAEKMEIINKRIHYLWNSIYKGNDIDYIQIKTDEIGESTGTEKRRSYNYRVVAKRNCDVDVDMRGRCSAGQKVLACLIIRIALAETFSNNCAVLALDEPTTNLDRDNILSLCGALKKLVEERGSSNLMLLIITHDESFVQELGKCEFYFKLSRSREGKSVIEKQFC